MCKMVARGLACCWCWPYNRHCRQAMHAPSPKKASALKEPLGSWVGKRCSEPSVASCFAPTTCHQFSSHLRPLIIKEHAAGCRPAASCLRPASAAPGTVAATLQLPPNEVKMRSTCGPPPPLLLRRLRRTPWSPWGWGSWSSPRASSRRGLQW